MINLFEKTIQHLSDINVLNNKLISQTTKTKTALQQYSQSFGNEPEIELIEKAFNNILQNPEPFHSPYEFSIFQNNCWLVFKAVQIFSQSMVKYDTESRLFENSLFNVSFIPEDNYTNDIYSAYLLHDEIISTKSQICNIKSSFKCGKTHCLPLFLSIKAIQENMERPFIIMVLPSNNLIENTIQDFDDLLGDSVYLINDYTELESMYENLPKKPVICMFTIRLLFEILSNAEEKKFQIFKYSRFILDGIYQKNLDTEELIEKFTKEMKNYSFPLQLICMAPVSHPIILDSFDEVYEFDLPDYLQTVKTAPEDEQKNIDELIKIGALNSNKTLNKIGRDIAPFSSLPPFVSISILNVARKYENKTIASLVGCLAFLILNTNNIIIDANTDIFRRNFDENSDIITLMSSLLELIQLEGNLKKNLVDGGFNPSNCSEVIETIEKIAFYINDNDDDKKSIWNKISIFYKSNSMMSFIKKILNQIEEYRPDWISCRRCEFINVINVLKNYFIVYKGDKSLTEDRSQPEIKISMRPGGKGFAAPGTCFIMQIKCPDKINYYGSIIHRDLSRKEICHPSIIEASIMMNNVYTVPIIEGYIGDLRSEFRPFQKTMYNKGNSLGECICYPEQFGDKTIISYTSNKINDENTKKIIEEAIQKAQKIMPYTPRTILVKNDVIKVVVSVTSFGLKNFTTQIINYTDKNPIPYSVNKTTIDYLIDHINELNDVDGHLVIAITGEKFSYSINEEETFIGNPTTNPTIPCVFGMIPDFYSHLVVLSNKPIPNSKQLNWVDRKISVTYSDVDSFILVANTIYRGAVEVTHEYNMIYCLPQNSKINLDGQTSGSANSINEILDNLAVNCTNGSNLINRIDFRGFSSSKNINCLNLEKDIKGFNLFRKTYPNLNPFQLIEEGNNLIPNVHKLSDLYNEKNKLVDRIKEIKADMKKLSDSFNLPGANKHDIIIQQHEKKLFKESIQNDIDSLTNQINECKSKIKPFCDKYHIDEVIAQKLLSITSPKQILELPKVFVYNSYIEINTKVDECDKVLQIIKEYKSDLVTEVVPLCLINVSHRINSNISKSQFIQKINDVCKRFGSIVKIKDEYKETEKSRMNKGFIRISILKGEFAVPFVNEIHKAIGNDDNIILKIPTKNCTYLPIEPT